MPGNKSHTNLLNAFLCSFGFMAFSFFIHFDFPFKLISFGALLITTYILSQHLKSFPDFLNAIGTTPSTVKKTALYCMAGLLLGMFLALTYRWYMGINKFPESIQYFLLVAALIGCTEELVFRGFIQEFAKSLGAPLLIIFSSLSHTGYKCCLFISPMNVQDIDIGFLALWTFIAGILLGAIKHFSKNIFPPLIAHAVFDILVYSEFTNAPWWVW